LINGTENNNQWSTGDGTVNFSIIGYDEPRGDEDVLYALQWKQGDAGLNITTGGTSGSYYIFIQDII